MKHQGKPGKRSGPVGYRTASAYLHRKCAENARAKQQLKKKERRGGKGN